MKKILNFTEFVNEGLKQDAIISINESDSKIEKADVLQNTNKRLYNFVMKLLYGPNLENINNSQPVIKELETHIWEKNLSQIVSNDPTKNTAGILWNTATIIDKLVEVIRNIDFLKSSVLISLLMKYNDFKDINLFKNDPDWNTLSQNEKDYIISLLDNFNFENYSKTLKDSIYSNSKVNYKSDLGFFGGRERMIVNLPGYSFSKITDVTKIGDFLLNKLCNYTFYYLLNKFKEKVSKLSKIPQMASSTKTPVSTKPKALKSKRKISSSQVSTETKLTTADLSKWGY
jgi:hypothetical protein